MTIICNYYRDQDNIVFDSALDSEKPPIMWEEETAIILIVTLNIL